MIRDTSECDVGIVHAVSQPNTASHCSAILSESLRRSFAKAMCQMTDLINHFAGDVSDVHHVAGSHRCKGASCCNFWSAQVHHM